MGAPAYRCNGTVVTSTFVKQDTSDNNSILAAGSGGIIFGVAQEGSRTAPIPDVTADPPQAGIAGESINVYQDGEFCLVRAGASITAGDKLKSDSNSYATPCTLSAGTREYYGAIALESASSGSLVRVRVETGAITTPA